MFCRHDFIEFTRPEFASPEYLYLSDGVVILPPKPKRPPGSSDDGEDDPRYDSVKPPPTKPAAVPRTPSRDVQRTGSIAITNPDPLPFRFPRVFNRQTGQFVVPSTSTNAQFVEPDSMRGYGTSRIVRVAIGSAFAPPPPPAPIVNGCHPLMFHPIDRRHYDRALLLRPVLAAITRVTKFPSDVVVNLISPYLTPRPPLSSLVLVEPYRALVSKVEAMTKQQMKQQQQMAQMARSSISSPAPDSAVKRTRYFFSHELGAVLGDAPSWAADYSENVVVSAHGEYAAIYVPLPVPSVWIECLRYAVLDASATE